VRSNYEVCPLGVVTRWGCCYSNATVQHRTATQLQHRTATHRYSTAQ